MHTWKKKKVIVTSSDENIVLDPNFVSENRE